MLTDYTGLCDNKGTNIHTHLLQIRKIICLGLSPSLCFHRNSKVRIHNGKTKCLHFMSDLGKIARFLCIRVLELSRKQSPTVNTCEIIRFSVG